MKSKYTEVEKAEIIIREVSEYYEMEVEELFSKTRKRHICESRQICQFLLKEHTKLSLGKIGEKTGGKDHATVLHSHKLISLFMKSDKRIEEQVRELIESIEEKFKKRYSIKSTLGLKKLDWYVKIRTAATEDEIKNKLIKAFNLNPETKSIKTLENKVKRLELKLERQKNPTLQKILSLPEDKLENFLKYKAEPHLKMNA